jgi:hypothetical protein
VPRPARTHPGKILFIIFLLAFGILAVYDLSTPNSILKPLWRDLFPGAYRGEDLRDGVMDALRPRQ